MKTPSFRFKQFEIKQDHSAMKIGTDGVLLGAWASISLKPSTILDIGTGTGLIALMLAQRSDAETIDALEIDADAYGQAVENFENSPWSDRLFCYHASLGQFANEIDDTYDLIVSNPPFYSENYKTKDPQRNLSRFNDAMPFHYLLENVSKLLSATGLFVVIIPHKEEISFINLAQAVKLYPSRILRIKGNPKVATKRSLIEFSFSARKENTITNILVIETTRHQYTQDYVNLTQDFYLKM